MKCQICDCHGEAVAQVFDGKLPIKYVCYDCACTIFRVNREFSGQVQVYHLPAAVLGAIRGRFPQPWTEVDLKVTKA